MRNDAARWRAPQDHPSEWSASGLTLSTLPTPRLTMMSGPNLISRLGDASGWPDVVTGPPYRLCLRRDRVLDVGGEPQSEGWSDETECAVSDLTSGTRIFQLEGPNAFGLLQRGAELSLTAPSASVARVVFGLPVALYRHTSPERFRLHVGRAQADAMWHALRQAARAMD